MRGESYTDDMILRFSEELPGLRVFVYEETESTNSLAKEYAAKNDKQPAVFIAKRQTKGRGRLGRSFFSEDGGLYMSVLLYPDMPACDAIRLTAYAAVCTAEIIDEFSGLHTDIKWVNDVLCGGKKLSGILTEGKFDGDGKFSYAVVGIGVNLRKTEFPREIADIASDVETLSGARADICDFSVRLAEKILSFENVPYEEYLEKYRQRSVAVGKKVKVILPQKEYFATVLDVEDDFSLRIKNENGEIINLSTGEVSIKL